MTRSPYRPDEYDLEQQHELNRRMEIAAEQEPAWAHYGSRNRFVRRNRPGPEPRYFSGLMFRPIPPAEAVANEDRMSYIRSDEDPAGHVDHRANAAANEGRDSTRRERGAPNPQPDGGGRDGAVPGVAA